MSSRETRAEILDRVSAYYDRILLPHDRDTFEVTREALNETVRSLVASILSDHELQRKWREAEE